MHNAVINTQWGMKGQLHFVMQKSGIGTHTAKRAAKMMGDME